MRLVFGYQGLDKWGSTVNLKMCARLYSQGKVKYIIACTYRKLHPLNELIIALAMVIMNFAPYIIAAAIFCLWMSFFPPLPQRGGDVAVGNPFSPLHCAV